MNKSQLRLLIINESLEIDLDNLVIKNGILYIKIMGKVYGYKPLKKTDSIEKIKKGFLTRSKNDIIKQSGYGGPGRALAWLKSNTILVSR